MAEFSILLFIIWLFNHDHEHLKTWSAFYKDIKNKWNCHTGEGKEPKRLPNLSPVYIKDF